MARDFDIKRVRPQGTNPQPPQEFWPPKQATQPTKTKKTATKQAGQKTIWPLLLLVLGLVLASAALYSQYIGQVKAPATKKPVETKSQAPSNSATPADATVQSAFDNNSSLLIQVYDSGAGEEATKNVTAALKAAGYDASNLGKSQFEYDKTYVWHTPEYLEEATAASSVLTGREISYKESKIEGVFDVLIYMGKK